MVAMEARLGGRFWEAWWRISSSMASSSASASLKPSAPKSLMPLSVQGLWDAEITTPALKPCVRARNRTAGGGTLHPLHARCGEVNPRQNGLFQHTLETPAGYLRAAIYGPFPQGWGAGVFARI